MVSTSPATQWAWSLGLLAAGLRCWPEPARGRLAALRHARQPAQAGLAPLGRWLATEPRRAVAVLGASALIGALLAGWGGALAGLVAVGTGYRQWRGGQLRRRRTAELGALLDAVTMMVGELRAGAHPATAAAAAGSSGERAMHRVLTAVAAGARLGGDVPALLERHAPRWPLIAEELARLAGGWALAERHGAGLAELLDAVRADLDARLRLNGQLAAQLAGPRASAAVLAGLPVLGIALGEGIGAHPCRILAGTAAGQVLLVIGTALGAAGVAWSARITGGAGPR